MPANKQPTHLVQRIMLECERLDISEQDLADRIGVSRLQVQHWFKGRREPSMANFCKIVEALGCTSDYLLGFEK